MSIAVIIPAYNEAAGIGRLLSALTGSPEYGADIEVVVVPNGCTDDTASVARRYGVTVVEVAAASKTAALNAGDAAATGFPRVYLDADIVVPAGLIRALAAALAAPGVHGAVPRPVLDAAGSSWPVRAFYAINARLPVYRGRLFGRGIIALSRTARDRFGRFPDLVSDDLFLDAVVAPAEKHEIDRTVRVPTPRTTGELIRRLARSRAGNIEFQQWLHQSRPAGIPDPVPGPRRWSWLSDVVARRPRLWPAAVCYFAVVLAAEVRRRAPGWNVRSGWGRPTGGAVR